MRPIEKLIDFSPDDKTSQGPDYSEPTTELLRTEQLRLEKNLRELFNPVDRIVLKLPLQPSLLASVGQDTATSVTIETDSEELMIYYEYRTLSGDHRNWVFTFANEQTFSLVQNAIFSSESVILSVAQLHQLLETSSITFSSSREDSEKPHYLFQFNIPMALGENFSNIAETTPPQTKVCMQIDFKQTKTARWAEVVITDASTKTKLLSEVLTTTSQDNWDAAISDIQKLLESRQQTDNGSTAKAAYLLLITNGFFILMDKK